jgi:hypothetical protein
MSTSLNFHIRLLPPLNPLSILTMTHNKLTLMAGLSLDSGFSIVIAVVYPFSSIGKDQMSNQRVAGT